MAFSPSPNLWIPGITTAPTTSVTGLVLPYQSFPELTPSEITGPTSDIRKIMFALIDGLHDILNSKPVADRPAKIIATRITGERDEVVLRQYRFDFELSKTGIEVIGESQ